MKSKEDQTLFSTDQSLPTDVNRIKVTMLGDTRLRVVVNHITERANCLLNGHIFFSALYNARFILLIRRHSLYVAHTPA